MEKCIGLKASAGAYDKSAGKEEFDRAGSLYCYALVRKDMPAGLQGAQAIHAALEAGRRFGNPEGLRVSFLACEDAGELMEARDRLEREGIGFAEFSEPDWGLGLTALATEPVARKRAGALKKLKLWSPGCCGQCGR